MNRLIKGALLATLPLAVQARNAKNVLFIVIDDLRVTTESYAAALDATPNMDRLARQGFRFEGAYCQQAVSGPSRASLLTGMYPDWIGVTDLATHFRTKCPDVVTMPQYFKEVGYRSICIGKVFHGSPHTQDTISWSEPERHNLSIKKEEYVLPENRHGGKAAAIEVADADITCYEDGRIAAEALSALGRLRQSGTPFFLAVGFKKPHLPFSVPRRFWDEYRHKVESVTLSLRQSVYKNIPVIALHNSEELRGYTDIPNEGAVPDEKIRDLLAGYYACTGFVDYQIGRLLDELQTLGLDRNTVVVIVSDNGFHLGEQNLWCKSTNFEIAAKVPLIVYDSEYETCSTPVRSIVEIVDIYPTLLELCGFPPKPELSGQSLVPLMKGESQGKNIAFNQFARPYNAIHDAGRQTHMGYSVRTENWRCTLWFNLATGEVTDKELYYLRDDKHETENLSERPEYADKERELSAYIHSYNNNNNNK